MTNFKYIPIIKTRDAELKCMAKLDPSVMDSILPVYELTKSRKTTITPDGDIHRRMKVVGEIQGERPFILDLCTLDKYINPQIEQLIDETNGYYDWRYFINLYKDLNIIPMVHLYDDENFTEVEAFVRHISEEKKLLAVRLPYDIEDIANYVTPITRNLHEQCKLVVILDADFIKSDSDHGLDDIVENFVTSCSELQTMPEIEDIVMAATSFPKSPAVNGDEAGEFDIHEELVFKRVIQEYPIKYGDYASINTEQIEIRGGTFVPRIDIALEDRFIYKRYRRHLGSYPLCAQKMLTDVRYKPIDVWADKEIILASADTPSGISPSFWIAIRMNYFMTSRVQLRLAESE